MRTNWQVIFRYLLIASAVAAAIYSFVLARASWLFQQDTLTSIPAAVALVPYDSAYVARLAAWRSDQKVALLKRAIQLNPFDFESLIQLGFYSEFQKHDNAAAEAYFLNAFDVNKMFLPKWTLVNFYFRHHRVPEFFHWATATLAITPYSPEPVFTQMWLLSQRAAEIAHAIPDRPRILLPYAWFLSNSGQNEAIPAVVQRLVTAVGKSDPRAWGRDDLLSEIEDRLVAEDEREPALNVWASMVKAGWLRQNIPSGIRPLTNGDFKVPFFQHGFDWRPASVDGVRLDQSPVEGLVRLQFSGREPEHCTILRQYIPLEAGRPYLFKWQMESQLADLPTGLTWRLTPLKGSTQTSLSSGDLALTKENSWRFIAPAGSQLDLLTLEYSRTLGHLPAKGMVTLKATSSEAQ